MNRKQLEECAWAKTPRDERRAHRERYDWKTKKTVTERLKGNNREVLVFDPSGSTPGTMSPWVPLWSLYSDELKQRCEEGRQPKLRAPYHRTRRDYTGDVESSGSGPSQHHATKKSPAQLQREIDDVIANPSGASGAKRSHSTKKGLKASEYTKLATATSVPGIEKYINEFAYSTNYRVDPVTLQITNAVKPPPESWFVMPHRGGFLFGRKH